MTTLSRVTGECLAKVADGKNISRAWVEVLLEREVVIGEVVDTDDLVGLRARVVIGNVSPRGARARRRKMVLGVLLWA